MQACSYSMYVEYFKADLKPDLLILRTENRQLRIPAFTDQAWESFIRDSGLVSSIQISKPTTTDAGSDDREPSRAGISCYTAVSAVHYPFVMEGCYGAAKHLFTYLPVTCKTHDTKLHFNSLEGLYRISLSFTFRGTWQSIMKGDLSARATQHLQGFFSSPLTFNLVSFFPGIELSHNFFKLSENF